MRADPQTQSPFGATLTPAHLPGARLLLRGDALFEGVLGAALATSPVTGLYDLLHLPAPASRPVVVVCGLLLVPLLPLLWRGARAPKRRLLLLLATANGASALVFALWVLIWHGDFHTIGAIFVLVVAGMLAILAALQARTALPAA